MDMQEDKRFEKWCQLFDELDRDERRELLNDYYFQHERDNYWYDFDEYGVFQLYGENRPEPMDVIRDTFYGDVNLIDDFIRFDGQGNLESASEREVDDEADKYKKQIYNFDKWQNCIDEWELDEDEEE